MALRSSISIVFIALIASFATSRAAVVFEFDYSGGAEFLDPAQGPARRAALEQAASSLGAVFTHEATIQLKVTSSNNAQGDLLASASSAQLEVAEDFFGFAPGVVQNKILTGIDANGAAADGDVDVNFGQPWDFDDQVAPNLFDFKATMIHEILHAVGFSSSIFEDGTDVFETPPGDPGVWSNFDQFIAGPTGLSLIDDSYALNGAAWNSASTGGASPGRGLTFNGTHAMSANGGQPVGLYSPSRWEEGSSGSHLDDDNPALAGSLMLAATDTGPYTRELSAVERGMLKDLGYSLTTGTPPSEPDLSIQQNGTNITLTIRGASGNYALTRSSDFSDWTPVATLTISQDGDATTYDVPLGNHSGEAAYFTVTPD